MDVSVTSDFLEKLPFEEWQSAIESLIEENPEFAREVLNEISCNHVDGAWRFNAVQILVDNAMMSERVRAYIAVNETDEEVVFLLNENQ